jgi:single-strand DNA-binding protein
MLNNVVLQGRLAADPEIRVTPNGVKTANMRIAVNRNYRTKDGTNTDFFTVVAWRTTAEFVERYVKKGQMIIAEGVLQNREWVSNDGKKRNAVEVLANNIHFCESKQATTEAHSNAKTDYAPKAAPAKEQDLPF